mmetsp:Transcript_8889/g.18974  ORF Transcript_8889/g.18974 Transcript_8889/m.18974 type:complete len:93 (-) Transcript_8889:829-1107(-)
MPCDSYSHPSVMSSALTANKRTLQGSSKQDELSVQCHPQCAAHSFVLLSASWLWATAFWDAQPTATPCIYRHHPKALQECGATMMPRLGCMP